MNKEILRIADRVSYRLDEPNVLLLDIADYSLDGKELPSIPVGYFTDKSIKTVRLPNLPAGVSTLTVHYTILKTT